MDCLAAFHGRVVRYLLIKIWGGNSFLETLLKLLLQQLAVPFEKLQSGIVADVKPDRAKFLGLGLDRLQSRDRRHQSY